MALSTEEILHYREILKNTTGFRDLLSKNRLVPEHYKAHGKRIIRTEAAVHIPSTGKSVTCYISEAKEKIHNCPVHINIHGGGFYYGHSEDDDLYCARIAAEIQGIVVDVDYALTPDYPFPVAFDQCYAAALWTFTMCGKWGADPARISLGGQSAGGNLTAAVALKAAVTGDFNLSLQVLEYAVLDFLTDPQHKPTGNEVDDGMAARLRAFSDLYINGNKDLLNSPFVTPFHASDEMLDNLPPALITTGGKDSLREEAEQYGLRMISRGVPVSIQTLLSEQAWVYRSNE